MKASSVHAALAIRHWSCGSLFQLVLDAHIRFMAIPLSHGALSWARLRSANVLGAGSTLRGVVADVPVHGEHGDITTIVHVADHVPVHVQTLDACAAMQVSPSLHNPIDPTS